MKKFLFFIFFSFFLLACKDKPAEPLIEQNASPAKDQVIAEVGPVQIYQQQLESRLSTLPAEDQEFAATSVGRKNFINLLVREQLALLDAKEENLDKEDVYLTALEDKREY